MRLLGGGARAGRPGEPRLAGGRCGWRPGELAGAVPFAWRLGEALGQFESGWLLGCSSIGDQQSRRAEPDLEGVEEGDLERGKDRAAREGTRQAGSGLVRDGEAVSGMLEPGRKQPQRESRVSSGVRMGAA